MAVLRHMKDILLRAQGRSKREARARIVLDPPPTVIYAVGDVHGCLGELMDIEAQIVADAAAFTGDKLLVMLGDYVDRGPRSADVIEHLCRSPPPPLTRMCLAGNHEVMMLEFLRDPGRGRKWLDYGGRETLSSYGLREAEVIDTNRRSLKARLDYVIPEHHRAFLESLPILVQTPDYIFVHAGLRRGQNLSAQVEDDLLWPRFDLSEDFSGFGKKVVHGHLRVEVPFLTPARIVVDTGAYATGTLTAVRLFDGEPSLFQSSQSEPRAR